MPTLLSLAGFVAVALGLGVIARLTRFGPLEVVAWAAPAAWAAAVLVRVRPTLWFTYAIALFLATVVFRQLAGQPVAASVAYGTANVCQALAFAWLVTRWCPDVVRLDRVRRVWPLLSVSVAVSVSAGAVLATGLVAGSVAAGTAVSLGVVRAGANLLALLTLAPAVFLGGRRVLTALLKPSTASWTAAVLATVWIGFGTTSWAYSYLPMAVLLLAVGYAGVEGAALLPPLIVPTATWLAASGHGPWGQAALPYERPLAAQAYGLTVAVAALLVGAVVTERRTALDRLTTMNESLEATVAERTRELAEQGQRSAAAAALGSSMARARLDEDAIWRTVVERIGKLIGDVCVLCTVDPARGTFSAVAVEGADPHLVQATTTAFTDLPLQVEGAGLTARAINSATTVVHAGTPAEVAAVSHPRLRSFVQETGMSAAVIVPVLVDAQVVATLSLHRHTTGAGFRGAEVDFLRGLATQAGLSVSNARLHARAEALAQRLQGLADADVAGILLVEDDVVREANDAFLTLVGRDRADLDAGLVTWGELIPRSVDCAELARLREQGRALPHQETLRRPDGSQVPVLLAGARLNARPLSWIGLVIDRSHAQETEQALARKVVHTEILAECSRLAQETGTLDPDALDHVARQVSDRLGGGIAVIGQRDGQARSIGLAHTDPTIAALHRRLLDEKPAVPRQSLMRRVIATGEPFQTVLDFERLQGIWGPGWEDYLRLVAGSSAAFLPLRVRGRVLGIVYAQRAQSYLPDELAFLSDLAERLALAIDNGRLQRAEQATRAELASSEERLRLAFDESPIGAALIHLDGAELGSHFKVNQALCALTGYPPEALTGHKGTALTHPEDREAARLSLAELAAGSRDHGQQERRLVRPDGSVVWARVTTAAIHRDGRPWYAIEHIEDISDRKRAQDELVRRALYDPLTGLGNRHLLMDHLSLALRQLSRREGVVAVFYLDLDRFKQINDTLGHDGGDEAIRQVGARLKATVRAPDTAARIGGDEFVVVSTHLPDEADALPIAERIQAALAEPIVISGQRIDTQASIGIVTARSPAADPGELLHQADLAMYQAKQHGRGNIAVYTSATRDPGRHRSRVEHDLRAALERDWFRLRYQPIIDLHDSRLVAVEALLRIDHPDRGLLLPEEFIDVAEDSDLIHPIGAWVLTQAAGQLAAWRSLRPDLTVAVNVSARQTRRPGIAHQVLSAAEAASVDPAGLSVEMTERTLIDADGSALRDLTRLTDLGVTLALDDFGTGYSSLTYLKRLPVHTVKIDRSFVAGLDQHPGDTAIVQAVTSMAAALNLTSVAEGVEHPAQQDFLRRIGCHQAQGFHICPPIRAEQITDLLAGPVR